MKVKTMLLHAGAGTAEGEVNRFIKDKHIIDIKMLNSNEVDKDGRPVIIAAIMYED